MVFFYFFIFAFSALTLLVGQQEGRPACEKTEWRGADVCLERGADLHTAQLMPLPLTASCFSKIQIGFTFLVPAHPGSPGQRAFKRVCVFFYFWCFWSCDRQTDRQPSVATYVSTGDGLVMAEYGRHVSTNHCTMSL